MSRTDISAESLAASLRRKAGDGSVEWVYEPMQAAVLLDIADMLDENAKLREELEAAKHDLQVFSMGAVKLDAENAKLRNEVDNLLDFEHLTSVAVAYAGCDECGEYKQTMLRLFAENAKLRELLTSYWKRTHSPVCPNVERDYLLELRELGVEV